MKNSKLQKSRLCPEVVLHYRAGPGQGAAWQISINIQKPISNGYFGYHGYNGYNDYFFKKLQITKIKSQISSKNQFPMATSATSATMATSLRVCVLSVGVWNWGEAFYPALRTGLQILSAYSALISVGVNNNGALSDPMD